MVQLSAEWSYIPPGQAVFCDRLVLSLGRRTQPRREAADRRAQERRCGWFILQAGRNVTVRIRIVEGRADASHTRCRCNTSYEFEEIPPRARSA